MGKKKIFMLGGITQDIWGDTKDIGGPGVHRIFGGGLK